MLNNGQLENLSDDVISHFGFTRQKHDLQAMFGDVKFVCCCGSASRARSYAMKTQKSLSLTEDTSLSNLSLTDRFCLYKVGSILFVSHGMGVPSISIMLVEMLKILHYAKCTDVTFFRFGTSGGIGTEPGSVIVTKTALNGSLEPYHMQFILGRQIKRPAAVDDGLVEQLTLLNHKFDFPVIAGGTLCADDYYEGEGRLDGAFCEFSSDDKMQFLKCLYDKGVRNMEMESVCFFAMLHRAGVKGALLAVTHLDRLEGDQVETPSEVLEQWNQRPCDVFLEYFKKELNNNVA